MCLCGGIYHDDQVFALRYKVSGHQLVVESVNRPSVNHIMAVFPI